MAIDTKMQDIKRFLEEGGTIVDGNGSYGVGRAEASAWLRPEKTRKTRKTKTTKKRIAKKTATRARPTKKKTTKKSTRTTSRAKVKPRKGKTKKPRARARKTGKATTRKSPRKRGGVKKKRATNKKSTKKKPRRPGRARTIADAIMMSPVSPVRLDRDAGEIFGTGGAADMRLVAAVKKAVKEAPSRSRWGPREGVFIYPIWRATESESGMSLDSFKAWLTGQLRRGTLILSRFDLGGGDYFDKVREDLDAASWDVIQLSKIDDRFGTLHMIND